MVDLQQLIYWLLVAGFFVAAPFLLVRGSSRRESPLGRLGTALLARLRAAPEEPEDVELTAALHRERLRADLERLQRLLATDASQSAARQAGNRIAYEKLRQELASTSAVFELPPAAGAGSGPGGPGVGPGWATRPGTPSSAEVETLEFGPRG